ncbi:MAG: tetratricopeptide repeat protein [Bacteroidota bacterium]
MRLRLVFLLTALAATPTVLTAPTALAQSTGLPAAQAAYDAGRYGEAIRLLTDLLIRTPDDAAARLLRAQAYEARRQNAEATADYERVLALRPGDADAEIGLQRVRVGSGQTTSSGNSQLEVFRQQVEGAPGNLAYRLQYAEALTNAERYAEAAAQYEFYLARAQGTPDVVTRYLVAIAALGQAEKGAGIAEEYLRLYPSNADLHMRLGYFRLWQSDRARARASFDQALALDPNNRDARRGLAELDQAGDAVAALERDLARNPNQTAKRYDLAELYLAEGRAADAQRVLDPIRASQAGTPAFDRLYARAAGADGPRYRVDELARTLDRNPEDDRTRFTLVDELIRLERYAEAFDQLRELEPRHSTSEEWKLRFEDVDIGLGTSDAVYAIDRYTFRLKVDPADLATRYALADELIQAGRYPEADLVLAGAEPYVVDQQAHEAQVLRLQADQIAMAERQIAALQAELAANPGADLDTADRLKRALLDPYFVLARTGALADPAPVLGLYEQLLAASPADTALRVDYVRFLTVAEQYDMALEQARTVYRLAPDNTQAVAMYAYAVARAGVYEPQASQALDGALATNRNDAGLLLAAATYYIAQNDFVRAEQYLRQAEATGTSPAEIALRRDAMRQREQQLALEGARTLYRAGQYQQAASAYGSYFQQTGETPRQAVREQAAAFVNAGDYASAIAALEALQRQEYGDDEQLLIARYRYDSGDYAGAAEAARIASTRRPDRVDARLLMGDAYREAGQFEEAQVAYAGAVQLDPAARPVVAERLALLDRVQGVGGFANPGQFSLLVVPSAEIIAAGGDGSEYRRSAQGVSAQFTLPGVRLPLVLMAGLKTHQFRGTRFAPPPVGQAAQILVYRANEVNGGAILDLGPRPRQARFGEGYTRRLTVEGGALTYTGFERTAGFFDARALFQAPGVVQFSMGYRTQEGAFDLWATGAPDFESRFSRIDVRGATALLDSLVRASGQAALLRVSDIDPLLASSERRVFGGSSLQGQVGLRLFRTPAGGVWIGPRYLRLIYDDERSYFFTPSDEAYQELEGYVEWERNPRGGTYVRTLAAVGTTAPATGFLTTRLEADVVFQIARTIGLGLNGRFSNSARVFEDIDGRYSSVLISGALYVAL